MTEKIESMRRRKATGKGTIQPGAHPEYETPPKFGNPIKQIGGALRKISGTPNPENTREWKERQRAITQRQATVRQQRRSKRGG